VRRRLRSSFALAAAGLLTMLAPAAAGVVPRPALGDWEGVGPHGLPLSFVLLNRNHRVALHNLVIGFPLHCASQPTPFVAAAYPRSGYSGPGAQPRVRLRGWKPTSIEISAITGRGFPLLLDGRLLNRRHATLSMPLSPSTPKHCGWPSKRVGWSVRPARRLPVASGTWTGSVTVPGGTGTMTARIIATGRIVDTFEVEITCDAGGGGSFGSGSPAGEFISASGAFEGWGYAHWHGRFASDGSVTGSFTSADYCGNSGGQVTGTFTARRG
jgi:hypothetical protein